MSEFGLTNGLSLIKGEIKKIPSKDIHGNSLKVPHMGWSELLAPGNSLKWNSRILKSVDPNCSAYFAHSFSAQKMDEKNIIAVSDYGGNKLNVIVQKDNIFGAQFHPEKSHKTGLKILQNFMNI